MSHVPEPWDADRFPDRFHVPTMLTHHEVNYLHWLAHSHWRGEGRVVELGCFLGGSTLALVTGMASNPLGGGAKDGGRGPNRLLTYDAFVMDRCGAEMFLHPYKPGERFRPLFDLHLKDHHDRIDVREGWIPGDIPRENERDLYPEQAPVEILFIDAAKTWPVHSSIMRTFGRHLIPGRSVVVQQDFKHFYCYWLALHMHELRAHLDPVHDVPCSASLGFTWRGAPERALERLSRPEDFDRESIAATWTDIERFWEDRGSTHAVGTVRLNRAAHFADAGLHQEATGTLERIVAGLPGSSADVCRRQLCAQMRGCARFIEQRARRGNALDSDLAARLGRLLTAPVLVQADKRANRLQWLEMILWQRASDRCRGAGARRIAVYGAGQHTARLLRAGWPGEGLEIAAILDDLPRVEEIEGVPVMRPADLADDVDAIVLSSFADEDVLREAADRALGARGIPIIGLYEDPAAERGVCLTR